MEVQDLEANTFKSCYMYLKFGLHAYKFPIATKVRDGCLPSHLFLVVFNWVTRTTYVRSGGPRVCRCMSKKCLKSGKNRLRDRQWRTSMNSSGFKAKSALQEVQRLTSKPSLSSASIEWQTKTCASGQTLSLSPSHEKDMVIVWTHLVEETVKCHSTISWLEPKRG